MKMEGFEIRPRLVWGRRPRVNGGRRRPRGWMGRYKLRPVVSRASYPAPAPRPQLPPAPRLDEFALVPTDPFPPTGNAIIDAELERLATMYGGISRIRLLLLARAEVMTTSRVYRAETKSYWKKHDDLLRAAESLREVIMDYGVAAPGVPERFYWKF